MFPDSHWAVGKYNISYVVLDLIFIYPTLTGLEPVPAQARVDSSKPHHHITFQIYCTYPLIHSSIVEIFKHIWSEFLFRAAVPVRMNNPTLGAPYISGWKLVPTIPLGSIFNATRFSINCNIGYPKQTSDDGVRFQVSFEADGVIFEIFTATSTNPVVALDESYLFGHLGKLVSSMLWEWRLDYCVLLRPGILSYPERNWKWGKGPSTLLLQRFGTICLRTSSVPPQHCNFQKET